MQVKKQQLEPDMEQQTGSKLGKEYVRQGCILSPWLFNFYAEWVSEWKSLSRVQLFVTPWTPWSSPGQNTGVGSHSFSKGSSPSRDGTQVSHIAGRFFTSWAIRVHHMKYHAGWITSWNQDCQEKYQQSQNADDTTEMAESKEELKSLLMKVKEESE